MSADPYSAEVRRLFAEPAHAGVLDGATVVRREGQGVSIELSARKHAGRLAALAFRARACPHLIAAAEAFCAACEGRSSAELGRFRVVDLARELGIPTEKTGRILVLEDTVRMLETALNQSGETGRT